MSDCPRSEGLGAAGAGLAWVVNAYLLPLSALLLLGGAAGDLYGRRRMLIAGVALFALASVLCAFATSLGALVAGPAFLWLERREGDAAMTPLDIFSSRSFVALVILTLLLYGALGALLVLIPYVLIEASGYSATIAGAALLPLPVVIALSSSQMGRLAARIGPRRQLAIGPVVVALGCVLAAQIGAPGGYWTNTLPALLVIAIGLAGAVAPLTAALLGSVDEHHTGVASGLNSAVARTGGLIAMALAASAAIWLLGTDLKPAEPSLGARRTG